MRIPTRLPRPPARRRLVPAQRRLEPARRRLVPARRLRRASSSIEGVLGTRLQIVLIGRGRQGRRLRGIERVLLAEIDRLEQIFSVFRPDSELRRWARGDVLATKISPELFELLDLGEQWWRHTGGVFHPLAGRLARRWSEAATSGVEPGTDELAALAAAIAELPYAVVDGAVTWRGPCADLNFNALAKGLVVDLALARAVARGGRRNRSSVTVSIGGDLRHVGPHPTAVAIENPHRPYDNEPPLATITIGDAAVATSGGSKRGWQIGDRWYSHVIDPRSGRPADGVASATVVAPDAATADVLATLASVLRPSQGAATLDRLAHDRRVDVAYLIVAADRSITTNAAWERLARCASSPPRSSAPRAH